MKTKKLTNILKDAKNASNQKTEPYDATGIVKRIENGVAWVHIGGGVDETPVRLTMNAKEGDAVQVRVSGGKAWLTGNATSPPTDDTMAYHATHVAQTAQANAQNAGIIAEESQAIAIEASQIVEELSETAITNVVVQYAVGTSPSVAPVSGWSTDSPTWEEGKYIWQRTVTTINGVQIPSNVACIQGAKGNDGTSVNILGSYDSLAELEAAHPTGNVGDAYLVNGDLYIWNGTSWEDVGTIQGPEGPQGVGISSVVPQYYLSTSDQSATGGSWSTTPQTWANGKYYWTRSLVTYTNGNTSYFPSANGVLDNALNTMNSNAYQALIDAGDAIDIAEAQAQHFWTDTDGVHIASEAELATAPRNSLWNSLGMLFRKGSNIILGILTGTNPSVAIYDGTGNADANKIAEFGSTSRIGKVGESHLIFDYHSIQLKDKEGDPYFYASDLRDSSGNAHIVETIESSGNVMSYRLSYVCNTNEPISVYENDVLVSPSDYTIGYNQILDVSRIDFNYTPAVGEIVADYYSNSQNTKAFTMGIRTGVVGANSFAEGTGITASGIYSHAEGRNTVAKGTESHSEGFNSVALGSFSHAEGSTTRAAGTASHAQNFCTIADYSYQTAIGRYNDNKQFNLFEIGYGVDDSFRKNVFGVSRYGDVVADGPLTVEGHNSAIGTVINYSSSSAYSTPTSNNFNTVPEANLTRPSLGAGTWIIIGWAQYASNSSNRRAMALCTVVNGTPTRWNGSEVNQTAVSGAVTKLQTSYIATFSETTTVTIQTAQNSGSALNTDLKIYAVRIA